jgi:hypothetical protein
MAFRDFTFPEVQDALGVRVTEADLFPAVPPATPRTEFAATLRDGVELALAVNTEKARSEFIIAPVLLELRRSLHGSFGLFSGIEFDVDASRGLNGYCDFILTRSPAQLILTAPLIAIVEAKNDNLRAGLGQCIAAMVAALEYNQKTGTPTDAVYGCVTTGEVWQFLRLDGSVVTIDRSRYYIDNVGGILGVLAAIVAPGGQQKAA